MSTLNANQTITSEMPIHATAGLTEAKCDFVSRSFCPWKYETKTPSNRLFHSRSLYKQPDLYPFACVCLTFVAVRVGEQFSGCTAQHKQCTTDRLQNGFELYESGNHSSPCIRFTTRRQQHRQGRAIVDAHVCVRLVCVRFIVQAKSKISTYVLITENAIS